MSHAEKAPPKHFEHAIMRFRYKHFLPVALACSAIVIFCLQHRIELKQQAKRAHDDATALRAEIDRLNRELELADRRLDKFLYVDIQDNPVASRRYSKVIGELEPYGVRLLIDRSGHVAKAEVPDTTDIHEVCKLLRQLRDLEIIYFTAGPLLAHHNWDSAGFVERYSHALDDNLVRIKSLDESYQERVVEEVKKTLPNVKIKQWPGAF